MHEHSRYEELCALAGVGQISADELKELQAHLQQCHICQDLRADFIGINSTWLLQAEKLEPEIYDPHSALRQKVLKGLQVSGAQFSSEIRNEISGHPEKMRRFKFVGAVSSQSWWAVAAVAIVGFLGFAIGTLHHSLLDRQIAAVSNNNVSVPAITAQQGDKKVDESASLRAKQQEEVLQQKLDESEKERSRIEAEVKGLTAQIAMLQTSRSQDANEIQRLKNAVQDSNLSLSASGVQIHKLQDAQSSKDAELVAANYRLRDLENKLALQSEAADRERQLTALAASSEMRDVIGSRNLHIVDVADVDNHGTKKPFGRVFYTEGKSLIFYAYDLANVKGKQTFYAWGHREGDPHSTRALGALVNDDQAQHRWAFKFNDAKVLGQIDSVYVTLEPTDRPGKAPNGKKLLNAYLGTAANHP